MRLKRFFILSVLLAFAGTTWASSHTTQWQRSLSASRASAKSVAKKPAKRRSEKITKKAVGRRPAMKATPTPALLSQPKHMPLTSEIPMTIATLLADGEIDAAARRLYMEPASVKNIMLIREMERTVEAQNQRKITGKDEVHRYYLNLGIAYHNLALFLKSKGLESKKFIQKARANYVKAKTADKRHRGEVEVLSAALEMMQGNRKGAATHFAKLVNTQDLLATYHGSTYLATYYAAAADPEKTVAALQNAKQMDTTGNLPAWAQIGDDFTWVRASAEFQKMLTDWQGRHSPAGEKATSTISRRRRSR